MVVEVRSEITLKFNVFPPGKPMPNKKIEIEVADQNGNVFTAIVNAKGYRKAEIDIQSFADWGGVLSGKLGVGDSTNGFIVIDAGLKVFEKVPKEKKVELSQS